MRKEREIDLVCIWVGITEPDLKGFIGKEQVRQGVYHISPGDIKGELNETRETIFNALKQETGLYDIGGTIYSGSELDITTISDWNNLHHKRTTEVDKENFTQVVRRMKLQQLGV